MSQWAVLLFKVICAVLKWVVLGNSMNFPVGPSEVRVCGGCVLGRRFVL